MLSAAEIDEWNDDSPPRGRPPVVMIAAIDRARGLGRNGALLYRIPADLARFRRLTLGGVLILGRKTFESLPGPLDGRAIVVVTRAPATERMPHVARGVAEAIRLARALNPSATIWIAGGARIYRDALPLADRIELTEIDAQAHADATFPSLFGKGFQEASRDRRPATDTTPAFAFVVYERYRAF
jgi:dihydrofolate reductase